jgi:hypothetical protein
LARLSGLSTCELTRQGSSHESRDGRCSTEQGGGARCSDTEKYLETSLLHRMGKVRRQFINKRDGGKTDAVGRVENLL